jgi:hypothetical protein
MDMYNDVVNRLLQLGYVVLAEDEDAINYTIADAESYVKLFCNIETVPESLHYKLVNRVCGVFLMFKKNMGLLTDTNFNFEKAEKTIKLGDTSVTYAIGEGDMTPEGRFETAINALMRDFDKNLVLFRRLVW